MSLVAGLSLPARAQILKVSGTYRVVSVDEQRHRFGVALPEANPDIRQNWCFITLDTRATRRVYDDQGWYRDEPVPAHEILGQLKKGDLVELQGGRDWDLTITVYTMKALGPTTAPDR